MSRRRAFLSPPCRLAAHWRALLFMAAVLARQVLELSRPDPRAALQKAEMLEAWCWAAQAELAEQVAAEPAAARAQKPYHAQLPPIAAILQMFLVFLYRVKAGLKARIGMQTYAPIAPERLRHETQLRAAPDYIDTS